MGPMRRGSTVSKVRSWTKEAKNIFLNINSKIEIWIFLNSLLSTNVEKFIFLQLNLALTDPRVTEIRLQNIKNLVVLSY